MNLDEYFAKQEKKDTYMVESQYCVGCGRCKMSCPENAIKKINGISFIQQDVCMGCGRCIEVCPHGAIVKTKA
ncbi:DUF362 domain-containing protein [Chakrabartyella piscis]|uniref:DUF362 domain-containing protein n=1 Tax=Chakrabartyella piscis TaxID=2918914 RepID=UPI002958A69B|nr:4Fe-4S binding protein [Chakrabartyella piscis]